MYGFDGRKLSFAEGNAIMIVDSLGLLLKVVVSEGNAGERVLAAYALMELMEERPEFLEKVEVMWVDSGYALYALEPAHEATFQGATASDQDVRHTTRKNSCSSRTLQQ